MPAKIDLVGKKFGRLVVIAEIEAHVTAGGVRQLKWECQCECGKITEVVGRALTAGDTKSCGCWKKVVDRQKGSVLCKKRKNVKSVIPGSHEWKEYAVWRSMVQRCTNPNNKGYKYYGARGITVCERWLNSFDAFFEDIGKIPEKLEIDRIDNELGYFPGNVRITTRSENMKNRNYDIILTKRTRNSLGQFA